MPTHSFDILILGSGFGGSLMAAILARAGRSVVMIDKHRHPRFAIGESSTPLADRTLAQIADRYCLPELRPLCRWGSWKRTFPELLCGKKRGFTYFDQTSDGDLQPDNFDARRLLVTASSTDEHSDTHWLRSDVDQFLHRLAESSGTTSFEQCRYTLAQGDNRWSIEGESGGQTFHAHASFLIDATGSPNAVLRYLQISDLTHQLSTNARSIFAHFASASTCEQLLREHSIDVTRFPYHCDDAAVHQVLPDGWMWQLRYDDDTLSAGFMIDQRPGTYDISPTFSSPTEEWTWRIARTPFLQRQFAESRIVRPDTGLLSTGRIQRLAAQGAGSNWAALTNTVGFIDPLHSTGIAHTLFSVSRLSDILLSDDGSSQREQRLREYSDSLISEIRCIDEVVEGCYAAIPSFRLWSHWCMIYFAAVTSMEQKPEKSFRNTSFLRASDSAFRSMLAEARQRLGQAREADKPSSAAEDDFCSWLKSAIAPWNHVGLFDDSCHNLYSATAAPCEP